MAMVMINITTAAPQEEVAPAAPFSYETYAWAEFGIYVVATGSFGVFGTFSNIINIIVFHRQGILTSSSTVHLTGLAVSDLFNCILTVWTAVTFTLMHFFSPVPFVSTASSLSLVTATRPTEFTIQTTCWITAFTAFERVICVLFPFKVKSIFTPNRSLGITITIFISSFFLSIPTMFRDGLEWRTHPEMNYTYLDLKTIPLIKPLWTTGYIIGRSVVLRFLAIFIVVACNIILLWRVNQSHKFRKIAATGKSAPTVADSSQESSNHQAQSQTKEMKLLKMITVVSVVFTVCYSFYVVYTINYLLLNALKIEYHMYVDFISWDVSSFFQVVNSSTNIIIYYKMSSRYKEEFGVLFKFKTGKHK